MRTFADALAEYARLKDLKGPDPRAPKSMPPECALCNDMGYLAVKVPFGHPDFGKGPIACKCQLAKSTAKKGKLLGNEFVIKRLKSQTFETFRFRGERSLKDAFHVVKDYAQNPNGWLLLQGDVGTGKTHLAAAAANTLVDCGYDVYFGVVSAIIAEWRVANKPGNEESFDKKFAEIAAVQILILDDFGTENPTAWGMENLYQLINDRYNAGLPTIFTTNAVMTKYAQRGDYERRIASRISDVNICTEIIFRATDCRTAPKDSLT